MSDLIPLPGGYKDHGPRLQSVFLTQKFYLLINFTCFISLITLLKNIWVGIEILNCYIRVKKSRFYEQRDEGIIKLYLGPMGLFLENCQNLKIPPENFIYCS